MFKSPRTILLTIFGIILVNLIGSGILTPLLPALFTDPSSSWFVLPKSFSAANGYMIFGFLVATYPFMQFIAAPFLGRLSDKWGRKKLLIISLAGTVAGHIIFIYGLLIHNILILFGARIIDGLTGGNISIAQAAVADVTTPEERTKNFGIINSAYGLGFILGPFVGGVFSKHGILIPFYLATGLSILAVLFAWVFLPETRSRVAATQQESNRANELWQVLRNKSLRLILGSELLFYSGFAIFGAFLSIFLFKKFNLDPVTIGYFFAFIGVWIMMAQLVIVRWIRNKLSEQKTLRFSIVATGTVIFLMIAPSSLWPLFLIIPFVAICNAISQANMTGLVSKTVSSEIQGQMLGVNSSVQALAQTIPPVLGGFLAARLNPSAPIIASSLIIFSAALLFLKYKPENN